MKIKKRNFITWSFFFTVIALENFFWLIPTENYIIPGVIKLSDIGVISALLWSIYVFLNYRNSKKNYQCKPMIWPIVFFVVAFVSSLISKQLFGQTLGLSFRQIRYSIVCFIYFYAIFKCLKVGGIKKSDVYKIIEVVALIESVLFILQSLLINTIVFINAGMTYEYTNVRIRVSFLFPMIYMYISLNEYMRGRNKIKNFICVLFGVYILAGVCQHRAPTMIMLCTFVIAFALWKKDISIKLIVFIVAAIAIISFLASSEIMQQALGVLFNNSSKGDTLTIRRTGRLYYFEQLQRYNKWWTGFGQANINCSKAYRASGAINYIFMVDNGIFGFLYCYGFIGIAWVILFFSGILKRAWYLLIRKQYYHYILYTLFEIGNLYMGMHWFYYYTAPFIIFIALLDWEYCEERKIKEKVCEK